MCRSSKLELAEKEIEGDHAKIHLKEAQSHNGKGVRKSHQSHAALSEAMDSRKNSFPS